MKGTFKKTKISFIAYTALTLVLGIILAVNPVGATVFICRTAGFMLFAAGLFVTGSYFLNLSENIGNSSLITGLIQIFFGGWVLLKPEKVIQFLTVIIGIVILIHGFSLLQGALEVKRAGYGAWKFILVFSLIVAAMGLLVVISPFASVAVTMTIAGICLIADGISGVIITIRVGKFIHMAKEAAARSVVIETTGEEIK